MTYPIGNLVCGIFTFTLVNILSHLPGIINLTQDVTFCHFISICASVIEKKTFMYTHFKDTFYKYIPLWVEGKVSNINIYKAIATQHSYKFAKTSNTLWLTCIFIHLSKLKPLSLLKEISQKYKNINIRDRKECHMDN